MSNQGVEKLPLPKQISYSIGQLGWSLLINIVNLTLVFFYIPPANEGLPTFVTQVAYLAVLNIVSLLAASGRLFDAITDPLIASWSDRLDHPKGRRIPFLKWSALPAAVFCGLLFFPIYEGESWGNVAFIGVMQFLFFLFLTGYVTPYFALIPELGHNPKERLNLATWTSITYALGVVLASAIPVIAGAIRADGSMDPVTSLQYTIIGFCILAVLLMWVPVATIDEKRYCVSTPSNTPVLESLKLCFQNKHFRPYVAADFAYFMGLTLILTGMLYYVTVLLQIGQEWSLISLAIIIGSSFLIYPLVNILAKTIGKRVLVLAAFVIFSIVFAGIYFLGHYPFGPHMQIIVLGCIAAIPMAILGVLPNAILADIAEHDALRTGKRQEGMYYGARTFLQKFGVTGGIFLFAGLTNFGKDIGNDLGLRLSGVAGLVLCVLAFLLFMRYKERQVLAETAELEGSRGKT